MAATLNSQILSMDRWVSRFWSKVDVRTPDECWEWNAAKRADGYGQFSLGGAAGQMFQAHRVSWVVAHGELPDGLMVRHRCDNPSCVNPAHLELGTHLDNMHDMATRGRHGNSRLTASAVQQIRSRKAAGETYAALAQAFGVSQSAIAFAVRRETWGHVA